MDIQTPKIPDCPHWPLITQLDHEKEVTGMFLSGHPLDPWKDELANLVGTTLGDLDRVFSERRNNRGQCTDHV